MIKKIIKILGFSLIFMEIMFSANAFLCIPGTYNQPQPVNSISVFDNNKNFIGSLAQLNNKVPENYYLKMNLGSSTFPNDIYAETFYLRRNSSYGSGWSVTENDFNLNSISLLFAVKQFNSILDGNNDYYIPNSQIINSSVPSLSWNLGGFHVGQYKLESKIVDTCFNAKSIYTPILILPPVVNTTLTCNGILNVATEGVSVDVTDACSVINATFPGVFNININYIGTQHNSNNRKNISLAINSNTNISIFTSSLNYKINSASSDFINFKGNFNTFDVSNIGNSYFFQNMNGKLIPNSSYLSNSQYYFKGIINLPNNPTGTTYHIFRPWGDIVASDFSNNFFSNYVFDINGPNPQFPYKILSNKFLGSSFQMNNFPTKEFSGNVLNFNFISINTNAFVNLFVDKYYANFLENISYMNLHTFSSNVTIGHLVNGKYIGNAYLDTNGNDIFVCPYPLNTISTLGKTYKVCSQPIDVGDHSFPLPPGVSIFDYIIVTNISAGGSQPILENKPPVAEILLNNYYPQVNQPIHWNIGNSYDPDGTIVDKKLYIDNVLYHNVNNGTFTSPTPTTINMNLVVTDNKGLTSTSNTILTFHDTTVSCSGATLQPFGNISAISLGNNRYTFSATNLFDSNGRNISSISWRINNQNILGNPVTTTLQYTQPVQLNLDDGCQQGSYFKSMSVTNNSIPFDTYHSPILNLNCSLSSQIPTSSLNCLVSNNLRGGVLQNIIWSLDGIDIILNDNLTTYSLNVTDTLQHNLIVTTKTNLGSGMLNYPFKLTLNPLIYDNGTNPPPPFVPPTQPVSNISNISNSSVNSNSFSYNTAPIIDFNSINNTNKNAMGFMGDIITFIMNIGIPIAILVSIIVIGLAIVRFLF